MKYCQYVAIFIAAIAAIACGASPEGYSDGPVRKSAGTGTLTIENAVSGGSATSEDFLYQLANDQTYQQINFVEAGETKTLSEGLWVLGIEATLRPPGYTSTTWSGADCTDQGNGTAHLYLSDNQDAECTATHTLDENYTEGYGEVSVNILIDGNQDYGCTATVADFEPTVGETVVESDVVYFLPMGTHAVTQNDLEDYWEIAECEEVSISEANPFGFCAITNYCYPF